MKTRLRAAGTRCRTLVVPESRRRRALTAGLAGLLVVGGTAAGIGSALAQPGPAEAADASPVAEVAEVADAGPATEIQVTLVQRVHRQVTIRSLIDPKKRLSANGRDLAAISAIGSYDVPSAALRAYKAAARQVNAARPGCGMPWTLLAGIGRVESDHGRYGGSTLGTDGLPRPAIVGVALDGKGPVAAIGDTDGGRWDGDKVWDRAVGPMQFIPGTWSSSGKDGDGDGVANPNDLDDASLAAAFYLCPSSGSILSESAMSAAIRSYNNSGYYVDLVLAFKKGYETGVFVIPSPPPAEGVSAEAPKIEPKVVTTTKDGKVVSTDGPTRPSGVTKPSATGGKSGGSTTGGPRPSTGGGGSTPKPTPTTTPTPTPPPGPVAPDAINGELTQDGDGFAVGGRVLQWGSLDAVKGDYDGLNGAQTLREELLGLLGKQVAVEVVHGSDTVVRLQNLPV